MADNEKLVKFANYVAEDLSKQGLQAHLDGQSQKSAALYGFAAALRRGIIDVLGVDSTGDGEKPGLLKKFGIG